MALLTLQQFINAPYPLPALSAPAREPIKFSDVNFSVINTASSYLKLLPTTRAIELPFAFQLTSYEKSS